jgi:putative salt-induced outer membrane protein
MGGKILVNYFLLVSVALLMLISRMAAAQEGENKPVSAWGGEAEIGILVTRGNTHTDTQNIKLGVHYSAGPWEHSLKMESLRTTDNGSVSADRFGADYRSTYQFSDVDYAFAALRFEKDRFAGYERRTTENLGYGRKLYNTKVLLWDVEAGVGARQTDFTDNTRTDEGLIRVATNLEWKFTTTSAFKEELFVERGSTNTLTQSTTSLKVKINSSLAMKLGFKIQDNSVVPANKKHTDSETSLTLVYDF